MLLNRRNFVKGLLTLPIAMAVEAEKFFWHLPSVRFKRRVQFNLAYFRYDNSIANTSGHWPTLSNSRRFNPTVHY